MENVISFNDAIKKLDIEDFGERIFHSNSHGELFHLIDYIDIANSFSNPSWFREFFLMIVSIAEEKWERPQSVYQHIGRILKEQLIELQKEGG